MEENEFRSLYHGINSQRCVFEKALNARKCRCRHARHFLLAGREGYGCNAPEALAECAPFLRTLRSKSRFSLGITSADEPLPHNKEIRVQAGGVQGLTTLTNAQQEDDSLPDIHQALQAALKQSGSIETLPYDALVRSVVSFQGRRKRKPEK